MKGDLFYLRYIVDCIADIERYTERGQEAFLRDTLIQDAVIRKFEVIGEATKCLTEDFRDQHPEIPWRKIIGFRNVLIHEYLAVYPDIVLQTVANEIPKLQAFLTLTLLK